MNFYNGREEKEKEKETEKEVEVESISEPIPIPQKSAARHKTSPSTASTVVPSASGTQGLLLLAIAAELHPQTKYYLGILLRKHHYAGIAIVGSTTHEVEVKQLKMDVYALIGQLRQELIVSTHFLEDWDEDGLSSVVQQASGQAGTVSSVLCTPAYERSVSSAVDILSLDRHELQQSWSQSLAFLHSVAKTTIPRIMNGQGRVSGGSVFLVMTTPAVSPAALLSQTTCNALLGQLREAYGGRNVIVGHADQALVPEPEPEPIKANGAGPVQTELYVSGTPDFTPSESPTKLWNMWALQNDLLGG